MCSKCFITHTVLLEHLNVVSVILHRAEQQTKYVQSALYITHCEYSVSISESNFSVTDLIKTCCTIRVTSLCNLMKVYLIGWLRLRYLQGCVSRSVLTLRSAVSSSCEGKLQRGSKSVILTSPKVSPGAFCRGLSHKCFDISLEQLLIREFYKALHNSHRLTSHRPCRFRLHEIVQVNMNSFILAPLLSALRVSRIIRLCANLCICKVYFCYI